MPEFSPSFIKVDPVTGLTFYDFDGHIHATGMDLTVGSTPTDPGATIAWNQANGARVASITSYRFGVITSTSITAGSSAAPNCSVVSEVHDTDPAGTYVLAVANPPAPGSQANGKIIDGKNNSDWIRRNDLEIDSVMAGTANGLGWNSGTFTLNVPGGVGTARCAFLIDATGYTTVGPGIASYNVYIDGVFQFAQPFYFNQNGVHTEMGKSTLIVNLSNTATHTIEVRPGVNLSRDANDTAAALMIAVANQH